MNKESMIIVDDEGFGEWKANEMERLSVRCHSQQNKRPDGDTQPPQAQGRNSTRLERRRRSFFGAAVAPEPSVLGVAADEGTAGLARKARSDARAMASAVRDSAKHHHSIADRRAPMIPWTGHSRIAICFTNVAQISTRSQRCATK